MAGLCHDTFSVPAPSCPQTKCYESQGRFRQPPRSHWQCLGMPPLREAQLLAQGRLASSPAPYNTAANHAMTCCLLLSTRVNSQQFIGWPRRFPSFAQQAAQGRKFPTIQFARSKKSVAENLYVGCLNAPGFGRRVTREPTCGQFP